MDKCDEVIVTDEVVSVVTIMQKSCDSDNVIQPFTVMTVIVTGTVTVITLQ